MFGLTNAIPWFQRMIDDVIERNKCKETFTNLDNITIVIQKVFIVFFFNLATNITISCKIKEEHDETFLNFLKVAANLILSLIKTNVLINPIVSHYWDSNIGVPAEK